MSDTNKEFVGQSKITLNQAANEYMISIEKKPDTRNTNIIKPQKKIVKNRRKSLCEKKALSAFKPFV